MRSYVDLVADHIVLNCNKLENFKGSAYLGDLGSLGDLGDLGDL